jgi:MurNAc alpha-1-phosphate uridylyltransferase
MKAMILAAGRGERMRPLTDATPKALLSAGRQTLIEHHIEALSAARVRDIVINVAWLGDLIKAHLGNGRRYGVDIEYSEEPDGALETGGGILHALPLLGSDPFWLVNGDVRTDFKFPEKSLSVNDLGHLIFVKNPDHNPNGDFGLDGHRVVTASNTMLTYSGIAMLQAELFAGQTPGRFPLAPLYAAAANQGRLSGGLYNGVWLDVGTPERLAQAAAV